MLNGLPLTPKDNKKVGPIVGVLVIVLVIIIAAIYFFSQKLNTTPAPVENTPAVTNTDTSVQASTTSSVTTSNDAAAIQSDLDNQLKDIDYSF